VAILTVLGPAVPRSGEILGENVRDFLTALHQEFHIRRLVLLDERKGLVERIALGQSLGFLEETAPARADDSWSVATPPPGLSRRQVEFTGPVDDVTAAQAIASEADVWVADFEDAFSPTWPRLVNGQVLLRDILREQLSTVVPAWPSSPTIMVKPRGWHLPEKHVLIDGEPISASLFDFGLYAANCATELVRQNRGPYFCLPKVSSHKEARLWNDIFVRSETLLGLPQGAIRATAVIETLPASFEMEEILYELRDHSAGLSVGQADLMFSLVKTFHARGSEFAFDHRNTFSMQSDFMRSFSELLVRTCRRRGAQAMGGIAYVTEGPRSGEVVLRDLDRVQSEKRVEAEVGFDGSQVADVSLVDVCRSAFTAQARPGVDDSRDGPRPDEAFEVDVLCSPQTGIETSEADVREAISTGIRLLRAWLRPQAFENDRLSGNLATAEVCRSRVWQWRHNGIELDDGRKVTAELIEKMVSEELADLYESCGSTGSDRASARTAAAIFSQVVLSPTYVEFISLLAYPHLD